MDKRTLLVIAALLLPVVLVIVLAQLGGPSPDINTASRQEQALPPPKAEKPLRGRSQLSASLPPTATQSDDKKAPPPQAAGRPRPPRNLEEARARARQRVADLDKMTEEEWQAEMEQKRRDQERWMRLPADRKMEMLETQQQQQQQRDVEKFVSPESVPPAAGGRKAPAQ